MILQAILQNRPTADRHSRGAMQRSEFSMESFDNKESTSMVAYNSALKHTLASGQNMLGSSRVWMRIWAGHSGRVFQTLRTQIIRQAGHSFRWRSRNTSSCSTGPPATAWATRHSSGLRLRCRPRNSSGPQDMGHHDSTNYKTACRMGNSTGPPSTAPAKDPVAALATATAAGLPAASDTASADWLMVTDSTVKVAMVTSESKPRQAVPGTVRSRINSCSSWILRMRNRQDIGWLEEASGHNPKMAISLFLFPLMLRIKISP